VPVRIRGRWILGLVGLVAVLAGCEPLAGDRLVIATSWSAADRERIESEFTAWLKNQPKAPARGPIQIDWLILAPGDDLERLAARRVPPDVVLGGPVRSFERLAVANRLSRLPIDGSPAWAVARQTMIRVVPASSPAVETASSRDGGGIAFDDPRNDPISLAWAETQLTGGSFREGYARLVHAAGDRRRIGRQAGSAAAAIRRSETDRAVEVVRGDVPPSETNSIPWIEGVAILAGGPHRDRATKFLTFLAETGRVRSASPPKSPGTFGGRELLADLLGATLVDAQDELWSAWSALEQAGSPPSQLHRMTEPPPWPPASIAKILGRPGEQAMTMVETLAGQLATDPAVRAWLITSWLSPPRPIDFRVLDDLTSAVGGRLSREPRFREWLRAEWTAWARQRYRRVLRAVGSR
jgi:hypothetical protein